MISLSAAELVGSFIGGVLVTGVYAWRRLVKELRPNSGTSFRDALDRLEKTQGGLVNSHAELAKSHGAILAAVHEVRDEVHVASQSQDFFAEQTSCAFFRANESGELLSISPEMERMIGVTSERARGAGWIASLHSEDRDRVRRAWKQAIDGRYNFTERFRFVKPSGESVGVYAETRAVRAHDGRTLRIFGFIQSGNVNATT